MRLLEAASAGKDRKVRCPDERVRKMSKVERAGAAAAKGAAERKEPETMYVDELKKALFEKCDSIAEFLEIMEAIEDRVYGTEESPAA